MCYYKIMEYLKMIVINYAVVNNLIIFIFNMRFILYQLNLGVSELDDSTTFWSF